MTIIINLINYIFIDHLDQTSFVVAIFSLFVGYWFWKNPIITEMTNKRFLKNKEDGTIYTIGTNHEGWVVEKIIKSNLAKFGNDVSIPMKVYANKKINPEVKVAPNTIEELNKLIYKG